MTTRMRINGWFVAAAVAVMSGGCSDATNSTSQVPTLTGPSASNERVITAPPTGKSPTLQELRSRNPIPWVGDSVRSVMRGYRADYTARRKSGLPLKGLCEGIAEYFTTRNAWGKSITAGRQREIESHAPKCAGNAKRVRFFSATSSLPIGEDPNVTGRSLALLDSLQQLTTRVEDAGRPVGDAVAMLTSGIDRVQTLAADPSLTDEERALVATATSGLTGAIAEGVAMLPAIMSDVGASVDDCTQRLGYAPQDPADCDREVYEMFGPAAQQLPRPILMCAIAMKAPQVVMIQPPKVCDGHQIIEGIAGGFVSGFVGGVIGGLWTGGVASIPVGLAAGIFGAFGGLVLGLAKTVWCEMHK
jgi:hypothetical protein